MSVDRAALAEKLRHIEGKPLGAHGSAEILEAAATLLTATCATCRWWRRDGVPEDGSVYGACIHEELDGYNTDGFYTPETFGCSLHTPREEPTDEAR